MDLQLKDKKALVTGSTAGIGFATARALLQEGAIVYTNGSKKERLDEALKALRAAVPNAQVEGVVADFAKVGEVNALIERIRDIDILINNVGIYSPKPFEETTDEMWQQSIDLLLMSAVHLVRASLPHLRQSDVPCVLMVTSVAVKQPIPNLILSNSIRMAVIGLAKSLALELGGEAIRFNSILPGWTSTERVHDLMEARARRNSTTIEEEISRQAAASPLGRMATPQEFANVATFLCSPLASYLTGLMLSVDGGTYKGTF